ncbi:MULTISPECIES: GAF domain-containing protein [Niastella]|uniref:GAF domain-containing protein n=1 Tax=Niastella soli TaxID=2821487 RepID=A0ABS3YS32_9BACT|nr:GAF domain-containing protein [Niastella soli]MBO9200673.1 GAF domain-containing protein [Niastella soli]
MQTMTININEKFTLTNFDTAFSLRPFINFLKKSLKHDSSLKDKLTAFLLEKLEQFPELEGDVPVDNLDKYRDVLELIFVSMSNVTEDETHLPWALGMPLRPHFVYGTDAFYKLMVDTKNSKLRKAVVQGDENMMRQRNLRIAYTFILERIYNFAPFHKNEIIHTFVDEATGLLRHLKINIDTRFIEVIPIGEIPELSAITATGHIDEDHGFEKLERVLPLELFKFRGMSVVTITDETAKYAVETIKNSIVDLHRKEEDACHHDVTKSLKTLVQNDAIDFNVTPLFRINEKLVLPHMQELRSVMMGDNEECASGAARSAYQAFAEDYMRNPRPLIYKTISTKEAKLYPFLSACTRTGIQSFIVLPLYYNNNLAGMLEIYTRKPGILDEKVLALLEPAYPVLAQLVQLSIDDFDSSIDGVIREKFTSLQPAVQWKFNEAAWHYLQEVEYNGKGKIETVGFESVYPLYGAVDIRNSTVERNRAQLSDLQHQFAILLETLQAVKKHYNLALTDEMIYKCRKWKNTLDDSLTPHSEVKLTDFLEKEAVSFLKHFKITHPGSASIVEKYFAAIEEMNGSAWTNRRQLEESMQTVNTAVNNYLDLMKDELQQSYPCYFERFRTDGVEYDIYIGQSIAPQKPFDILYLKNLRLWQISSMAAIAKITHDLLPRLSKPLETTQLIFIHSNTIDISFRNDERRFDAEGGYNIRYQVIKKRIDKVHVADTNERLTQPGKIALVYFNRRDADEYISHIQYLQEQGILLNDLEFLDLEELQGVAGLRALRVGINLEYDHAEVS